MSERKIWIVVSKQFNPNDFYVKVDGSDFYTAFWVASATTKESALSMVDEAVTELDLGKAEIIETSFYDENFSIQDLNVMKKIETIIERVDDGENVQLAAWITSNGGLW